MPILYIHGVNTRSRDGFFEIKPYLQRLVAPAISADPEHVLIDDVYWGDVGVTFAWDGASRPRSRLLGMGAGATSLAPAEAVLTAASCAETLQRFPSVPATAPVTGGLVAGGATPSSALTISLRLKDLAPDTLSDLLALTINAQEPVAEQRARLVLAADAVAHDPDTLTALATARHRDEEVNLLLDRVRQRLQADAVLLGMGFSSRFATLRDRLREAVSRAVELPTYAVSVVAAELRVPLNTAVSVFIGDVFAYLNTRVNTHPPGGPGEIPQRFIAKLKEAHDNKRQRHGEPLVVLSHSMGGQIVYDAVSSFLVGDTSLRDLRIDFWCATASQVGFFEEAKLFLAQNPAYKTGNPVPFPQAHLGVWWNVWDHNDFLSYTVRDIIAGVDDEPYDSGFSLLTAHGGYLQRPSFFRKFARKLAEAAARGWKT